MSLVFNDCHCLPDTYIRCGALPKLYCYYEPNGINEEERQKDIGETVSMAGTLSLINNVPPEPKMVSVFIFDRCISPLLTGPPRDIATGGRQQRPLDIRC